MVTAPPISVMNSRRFTSNFSRASNRKDSTPGWCGRPTALRDFEPHDGSYGSDSVIRRCRFNVRLARRRTWLKGAQHLILCRSLPPGQRTRPCIGRQFGQIVSHKYRFRVRTQPRLWAAARDVLRAVFLLQARWRKSHTGHKKAAPRVSTGAASSVVCRNSAVCAKSRVQNGNFSCSERL